MPHQAVNALENDPDHLIPKILSLRAFVQAKAEYQRNGDVNAKANPLVEVVRDLEFDMVDKKLRPFESEEA